MHKSVTLGLGLVLLVVAADLCEAGPILNRLRARRFRQWTYVTVPVATTVTSNEQSSATTDEQSPEVRPAQIPTNIDDASKVEQATALEPIEEAESTATVATSEEPIRERRFQRWRFGRQRFTRLRGFRRR